MPDRINSGDTEEVIDQAAGPGAPSSDPDPPLLDQVDDLGNSEEIAGEAEFIDGPQLFDQPDLSRLAVGWAWVGTIDGTSALLLQNSAGLLRQVGRISMLLPVEQHIELGNEDLAEPEVCRWIKDALLGELARASQQWHRVVSGCRCDLISHRR
ncbi:unannotated protein [freshwater metagenome]|uniref:Unannotated protein n=1 Tax=freshwater metagenome TaxID=449393 RepID=A0A6J7F6A4_9ZZZZ